MTIVAFANHRDAVLLLKVEPWGEKVEIPHLATAGIRYTLKDGAEDRCYSSVSEHSISFWCNADSYEVDIVYPSAYDRLAWDICVTNGYCGSIVNGEPSHVDHLLPTEGLVAAREFAELVLKAEGWPVSKPFKAEDLHWLEAKFVEHLGAPCVDAESLRRNCTLPFEAAPS